MTRRGLHAVNVWDTKARPKDPVPPVTNIVLLSKLLRHKNNSFSLNTIFCEARASQYILYRWQNKLCFYEIERPPSTSKFWPVI